MDRPLTVKEIEAEYLRVYKAPPPSPKSSKSKGVKRSMGSMEPMKPNEPTETMKPEAPEAGQSGETGPSGVKKAKPTVMALVEMEEKLREWVGLFQQAAIDMHKIADKLRKHQ